MTTPRVTSTTGGQLMLANLQRSFKKLTAIQDEVSSGKILQRPSDDPPATLTALDFRAQLRRSNQYERNTQDAQGWLNLADSTALSAQNYLVRVRDLTLQARNAGDPQARTALANEIDELRSGMLQLANTRYGDRPLFAGTRDDPTPYAYDSSGAYQGNSGAVAAITRSLASGVSVTVNATGPELFGADADPDGNLFQQLSDLSTAIRAGNDADMSTGLDQVDDARARIADVQARLGARAKRVEDIATRNSDVTLEVQKLLSGIEDVDLERSIINMQTQQMGYQAALSVTAKAVQQSLLDFLR